jgi:Peptidase_C39 like family
MGLDVATPAHQTGFARWRTADAAFDGWQRAGVDLASDGALRLDLATAVPGSDPYPAGGYNGHNFYNGGSFMVGEALGPVVTSGFGLTLAIASWNADTPAGTWIETQIRARIGRRWTRWYNLGVWAADTSTVERHSVGPQGDNDGLVAADMLVLKAQKRPARAFQLKLLLFSAGGATPVVRNVAAAFSTRAGKPDVLAIGDSACWDRVLPVPTCSQMVYPDGGNVWCSPTALSMALAYWQGSDGACEPRVRTAVDGVYDWCYDGHGNWPFNTAYAATQGFEAYVARFTSMCQAEAWIAAGVPVVFSLAWQPGDLSGAPILSSDGHLAVLVGFDAAGNPVVNDPAAASDDTVRRVYDRAELESLWLEHSGGTVYLIYPPGWSVPEL